MTYTLHISVSNQSLEFPKALIEIEIAGKQIFHKEMITGTQHNWEEINESSISKGEYTLIIRETKTKVSKSQKINVDRELWIVITFHGPKSGFIIDIKDQSVGYI